MFSFADEYKSLGLEAVQTHLRPVNFRGKLTASYFFDVIVEK